MVATIMRRLFSSAVKPGADCCIRSLLQTWLAGGLMNHPPGQHVVSCIYFIREKHIHLSNVAPILVSNLQCEIAAEWAGYRLRRALKAILAGQALIGGRKP